MKQISTQPLILTALLLFQPNANYCAVNTKCHSSHVGTYAGLAAFGIGVAGMFSLYKWFKKPKTFEPTIENLNTITARTTELEPNVLLTTDIASLVKRIHQGKIPPSSFVPVQDGTTLCVNQGIHVDETDPTVFIFSRGYARTNTPGTNDNFIQHGACATAAYIQARDNITSSGPCICFDYPDQRRTFSFAQKTDVDCLRTVYEHTRSKTPNAQIVLVGDCRGAKSILEFCTQQPNGIKAAILMSPFTCAKNLTNCVAKSYLQWLPKSSNILYGFFKFWFPNYKEHNDNLMTRLHTISKDLPILIGHRKGDTLVSDEQMYNLVKTLKDTGNKQVHFVCVQDNTFPHSRITHVKEFQHETNAFLKKYGIAHNSILAEKSTLLDHKHYAKVTCSEHKNVLPRRAKRSAKPLFASSVKLAQVTKK